MGVTASVTLTPQYSHDSEVASGVAYCLLPGLGYFDHAASEFTEVDIASWRARATAVIGVQWANHAVQQQPWIRNTAKRSA